MVVFRSAEIEGTAHLSVPIYRPEHRPRPIAVADDPHAPIFEGAGDASALLLK